ncbi:hypothetical protein KFK09_007893 [Dendrobium nobile]|uniref:DUF4371 domain-containing protein n=1 Tax=Dendrobium nobile TaxID=94219 RepID=A0A8T3BVK7_DENNO|nr:hypothetical protein KFK09_007893 [Dendrobium nobile]
MERQSAGAPERPTWQPDVTATATSRSRFISRFFTQVAGCTAAGAPFAVPSRFIRQRRRLAALDDGRRPRRADDFYSETSGGGNREIYNQINVKKSLSWNIMERYFKRSSVSKTSNDNSNQVEDHKEKRIRVETDLPNNIEVSIENLPSDPGLRIPIVDFNPNIRDEVRRLYLQRGPFQPRSHDFPKTKFGMKDRRFNPTWFDKKSGRGNEDEEAFNKNGFANWKKTNKFDLHVGGHNSAHNNARRSSEDLLKQSQHIGFVFQKQTDQATSAYRIRLNTSVDCIRFLLKQGLAFRDIDDVDLKNAPENLKLIAPEIQKDITRSFAIAITKFISEEIGDKFYSVLVDESRDTSAKEQMAIIVRFVNKKGNIVERFLGISHVSNTAANSLKLATEQLLSTYGLSISRIRGQGYDGASNMRGEFNGLKALFLNENQSAHYIHCFSHQLQLALVAVAKSHVHIALLFTNISSVMNLVGVSSEM